MNQAIQLAYPISVQSAAYITTLMHHARNMDNPEQICIVNLPQNASNTLISAVAKLHICLREHFNEQLNENIKEVANLKYLFLPFTDQQQSVVDYEDFHYSVVVHEPLTAKQLEAYHELSNLIIIQEVCAETVLRDTFDIIGRYSLKDLTPQITESTELCNPDVAKVLKLFVDYAKLNYGSFDDIPTLTDDLSAI